MSTIKELIKAKQIDKSQDADGQFKRGSDEQQYATRFVELFFTEYDTISSGTDEKAFQLMVAGVLNALRDLQVRDYMLGTAPEIKNVEHVLSFLTEAAPREYKDAPASLLSLVYYENDKPADARLTLKLASNKYPLAVLLERVFNSGWPKESFKQMRSELHPKVVEVIFGDKE